MIEARFNILKGEFRLDASFEVPSRGVTAIFGPSGSGKTTLLRTFAGLERHEGCSLRIDDEIWQDDSKFVPPHKRSVGYVFQEASLFPHLSVRRNIRYGITRITSKEVEMKVSRVSGLLGIDHLLDRMPAGLSGGESQRVAIARALAVRPRILLMDEPLSSLDAGLKNEILPYLDHLHEELEIPVLYVSHSADEVARLADHIVLLEKGRAVAAGSVSDVLTRLDLPAAHREDAEAIVDAVVSQYDEEYGLALLDFHGGVFTVPSAPMEPGKMVRLRIAARDVSLTLEKQADTSILNIFAANVVEVSASGPAQVTVLLDLSGVPVLTRITRRSAAALSLAPGKQVFAQVKSVAVIS